MWPAVGLRARRSGRAPAFAAAPQSVTRYALRGLDRADRDLAAARIVLRVELHLLALAQAADAGALERSGVDEHVLLAIVRLNEAEAFLVVIELYGARNHGISFVEGMHVGFGARTFVAGFPVQRFWRMSETCTPVGDERSGPVVGPNIDAQPIYQNPDYCKGKSTGVPARPHSIRRVPGLYGGMRPATITLTILALLALLLVWFYRTGP